MKCNQCQAIFPNTYDVCPCCNSKDFKAERFAPQQEEEQDDTKDNPLIVNGEFNFDEMNDE